MRRMGYKEREGSGKAEWTKGGKGEGEREYR